MAQIIIPKFNQATGAGTLGGIAKERGTNVQELMRLNPNIQDPNKIFEGASLNVPDVPGAPIIPPTSGAITFNTQNPALQSLINETNRLVDKIKLGGGVLTSEILENINKINTLESQKISNIAGAREAADKKDATALEETLGKTQEAETEQKTALDILRERAKTLEATSLAALTPTEAETELKRKLNTLRTERQLLPLELRQEGISAAGIAGRQVEDERVRAIQEQNLLFEIGLKQEARQFATLSAEKQLGFLRDDITLQNKIDEQLKTNERQIVEDARNLRKDSLSAMKDILDDKGLGGLAWEDLDAESQSDLIDTAKQFNIPLNMLQRAMKNVKQQKVFDNAVKADKVSGEGIGGGVVSGVVKRDADSVMSGTLNLQDISVKDNYRADVAAELSKRFKEAMKTGDVEGMMRASAVYDKEPSDTFLTSMEKTIAVISQIETLQENIKNENTGPIVGAFRSANPWDTQAQTIKAQLNAIVPNLARGVYGEVGVLTDNDIKQYSKTLPTLTSTEAIRNAILYITVDQIRKNVEIKIKNQASGQRDMSGYSDVYKGVTELANNILATIPAGNTPQQEIKISDEEAKKAYQEIIQQPQKQEQQKEKFEYQAPNLFSDFWQGLNKFWGK